MSQLRLFSIAIAISSIAGVTAASAFDGGLVRIETRPYYGAVITVEKGVRVYRPLPSQTLMIINPNQTPVNLSFSRSVEYKAADNNSDGNGGGASDNGGRSGGLASLGNVAGTNPQTGTKNRKLAGMNGMRSAKHYVRRLAKH